MNSSSVSENDTSAAPPGRAPCTHGRPAGHGNVVVIKGPRASGGKREALSVSREAQRVAAAVLEVLAGVHTPTEAAKALSVSVPRYYLWEQRALEGLVRACEPRPQGKAAGERHQIAALEKEVVRWRQECTRQQALARAAQRAIALGPPPQAAAKAAKGGEKAASKTAAGKARRKRRPVVRALTAAVALQAAYPLAGRGEIAADSSSATFADVVQQGITSSSAAAASGASAPAVLPEA